ncbi:deoxyribodipyrimidine photo-lyase [Homoserinimonas sp. OAct 916]|uniref:cryptochrome/photolyase family protein n=1 Tax=Homoserinimonas sp. OAct 916 TaxID=2211450 RepID=UPI000DBE1509|nr:deoxyribodipyrimidine photo-lyase [Homoserinimonas sp. OAct 916]
MSEKEDPSAVPGDVTVVWFRDDLRVADNPALSAAVDRNAPVVALYVLDDQSPDIRPLGGAAKWWLHESLLSLERSLGDLGVPLVLRAGPAGRIVTELVAEVGATAVVWNRRYGAGEIAVDTWLKAKLRSDGAEVESFQASLLFEPWTIRTGTGTPYSVFTPFWRACRRGGEPRHPMPVPRAVSGPAPIVASESLESWALQPTRPDWAEGLRATWTPGEAAALERLHSFLADDLEDYADGRDIPADPVTSRLSPHLRWGELSAHQIWHEVGQIRAGLSASAAEGATRFLTEIGWREFAWHVLFHFPKLADANWRAEFDDFPWPTLDRRALVAWQSGRTGVPLVDAGMRELWHTGTMHNRVRMVAASFLTKNLLIDWREGERWFWDTLVDADAASNPFNWQWVAGSGADAAPYFRVFNPQLQAKKFDPQSAYIRAHVPEWGSDAYPEEIVDLDDSRRAALSAHQSLKQRTQERTYA